MSLKMLGPVAFALNTFLVLQASHLAPVYTGIYDLRQQILQKPTHRSKPIPDFKKPEWGYQQL
jgi:hypothetical protein